MGGVTRVERPSHEFTLWLVFDQDLRADGDARLHALEAVLRELRPGWGESIRLMSRGRAKKGSEQRSLVDALFVRYGPSDPFGSGEAHLSDAHGHVELDVEWNPEPFSPMGRDRLMRHNSMLISFFGDPPPPGDGDGDEAGRAWGPWVSDAANLIVHRLNPWWGELCNQTEKGVKSRDPDTGQPFMNWGLGMPGIFSTTVLGADYVAFLGADRVAAARRAALLSTTFGPTGNGVVLRLCDDPQDWDDPDVRAREAAVIDALGADAVFQPGRPDPSRGPNQEDLRRAMAEGMPWTRGTP